MTGSFVGFNFMLCVSQLIPTDIERSVKDAEDVDIAVSLDEVCDAIVAVEKDANIPGAVSVAVSRLRKFAEHLCLVIDSSNDARCSRWIVLRNVLEDILKPLQSFMGPTQLCHERIR